MKVRLFLILFIPFVMMCSRSDEPSGGFTGADKEVRLITLNPGHFHAGLVQMNTYPQVDSSVHVYAPEGPELNAYQSMIEQFNSRESDPTHWNTEIYTGDDYLRRMLSEKPGNVIVVAGNNSRKMDYIRQAVEHGLNVYADKPMVIQPDQFSELKRAMELADDQGLVVNDIMTERHEITSILQKELSMIPGLFGELIKGTPEEPAITKESVHFFYKTVAGEPLIRPAWFFDVNQQGEAIVDVTTHLVDLILWQAFPETAIDYRAPEPGVEVLEAKAWKTELTQSQFELITGEETFPEYLAEEIKDDSVLHVKANGDFIFTVGDMVAKVSARWGFTNPEGGDTHYSVMRGTHADLVVRQDAEHDFVATLYAEPREESGRAEFENTLNEALEGLSSRFPGLTAEENGSAWKINIPEELTETHEQHFTRVTERFLNALVEGQLPEWERTNLLTKYYLITRAYDLSRD